MFHVKKWTSGFFTPKQHRWRKLYQLEICTGLSNEIKFPRVPGVDDSSLRGGWLPIPCIMQSHK